MNTAALRIDQLAKRYRGRIVLDGIDLRVEAGQCCALIGLNGAGKTTLLHCVLDFICPDSGTIEIGGVAHRAPYARRRLAYLPERFLPPPFLSGHAFLRYAVALHGQAWDRGHVEAVLAAHQLAGDMLNRKVATYSKGMAQQLGLAACMLVRPALLVLDEPMTGLDPQAVFRMMDALRAARRDGTAILLTTHDVRDVLALSDRVAILQSGQLRTIEREQIAGESLFVHHPNQ